MAKNRAQGRVAASASKTVSKQKRSQLVNGGLAVAALVLVAAAIVVGVKFGGSGSAVGERAPDFSFTLFQGGSELGGRHLNIHQLDGKPVILNFWAGLCPPVERRCPISRPSTTILKTT